MEEEITTIANDTLESSDLEILQCNLQEVALLLFKQSLELNLERARNEECIKLVVQAKSMYMELHNDVVVLNFELKQILDSIQHLAVEEGHIEE